MSAVRLEGCTPEPLAAYLRALAVLRLVAEQADPEATGAWAPDGVFILDSTFDEESLVEFFLQRYAPTPIIAPWNGGSGFYPKDRKTGIDALAASSAPRFAPFRDAIRVARAIDGVGDEKAASKTDEDARRLAILRACRNRLPDGAVDWLDAAIGISAEGKRAFAPILGTGGNEGRLDYTNNFMENLAVLLIAPPPKSPVRDLLRNALFGDGTDGLEPAAVGQYDPGRAGGFNQGQGVETKDIPSNPWAAILTLEGAVAWASGIYRRQGINYRSFLCSPLTVMGSPVGYGSAAGKDDALARAEIWAPLWSRPISYAELRAMLREGRAMLGAKPARNGLEFAQAACMLGVDRGIDGFVRYNLLKRRGDSYIALPAGRFPVDGSRRGHAELVRQLAPLLDDLERRLGPKPAAQYASLRRSVDEAIFQTLLIGQPDALQDLTSAVGRLYRWVLLTGKIAPLRAQMEPGWVPMLPAVPEVRISAALASIYSRDVRGIRENLDRSSRQFAWTGSSLSERLASVLERRLLTAGSLSATASPIGSAYRASVSDVTLFLEGALDDDCIEELLFAFLLVRWEDCRQPLVPGGQIPIWPVFALLKLLFLPKPIPTPDGGVRVQPDSRILAFLRTPSGIASAADVAIRRLQNAGLNPLQGSFEGGLDPQRLAASLLIPVAGTHKLTNLMLRTKETQRQ